MSNSDLSFEDVALLDNPIWSSLVTDHAALAVGADVGQGLARRYATDIGPLSGMKEPTPEAFADLAAIVPEGDVAVLFLKEEPEVPEGWKVVRRTVLVQMISNTVPEPPSLAAMIQPMGRADFADMVALTAIAEPGPFRSDTASLGGFLGIRVDGQLVAMAGERLSPRGFTEVSAVCTHPDFRGRGYARDLVAAVTRNIYAKGRRPFLNSREDNTGAIRVYQQVGFAVRWTFPLRVVMPPPVR